MTHTPKAALKTALSGNPKPRILTDLTTALRETTAAIHELHAQLVSMAQAAQTPQPQPAKVMRVTDLRALGLGQAPPKDHVAVWAEGENIRIVNSEGETALLPHRSDGAK